MLNLGALINVMPTSVYKSLHLGDLKLTSVVIQLANMSVALPLGVLEDVLVQISDLIFPTDFNILQIENESSSHGSTLILGRPFLMTARTKIDVHARTISMEFGDDIVHFNIFESMRHPAEEPFVFLVDIIDVAVDSVNTCTDLLSDIFYFDLGSFNCACDDLVVYSICAEIAYVIHSDCVVGTDPEYAISLMSQHALLRASEARLTSALSKGGKMHGVATNVYLWKTSEKPKETGRNKNSKFGSCIYV